MGINIFKTLLPLMFRAEDGGSNFLRKISMYLLNDVTSHPNTTILSNPFRPGTKVHLHLSVKVKKYQLYALHTYLLTPWSRVLLEKLTGSAASQEILHIFGTRRFITVLTSARHLSLS